MAAPQSKSSSSCSPLLNRPTNPRNSEISNPMRRSFSGNPFAKPSIIPNQKSGFNPNPTPNSSSDHFRRNSTGRESPVVSSRDYDDKENGKDPKSKLGSVKSPASSPGMKNFMSPTISAASKVNASPRKKILTERNESVRISVSISNGNGPLKEHSEFKQEKDLNQKKGVSFNPTITYMEEKEEEASNSNEDRDSIVSSNHVMDDFDSFLESVAVENDFVNLDPSFKISPRTSSPALAPLDADPLMPPYDLKTNYVSPRPQFLHYKPNPLVELYIKQRDGKQLEESFSSESSSDAEITEQETVSEESSFDPHKESEDAASGDIVTEEEEEEEAIELPVSEPNPITMFEGHVEARKMATRHFFIRPKFTALLFVLALALAGLWGSVSNSNSLILDPSVLNNLNFPNLYIPLEISEFTREHLEGLCQKFRKWYHDSLSYIQDLVISFREWHNPGCFQFGNLTMLLEENSLKVDYNTFVAEIINERNGFGVKSFKKEGDQPVEDEQCSDIHPTLNKKEVEEEEEKEQREAEERFNTDKSKVEEDSKQEGQAMEKANNEDETVESIHDDKIGVLDDSSLDQDDTKKYADQADAIQDGTSRNKELPANGVDGDIDEVVEEVDNNEATESYGYEEAIVMTDHLEEESAVIQTDKPCNVAKEVTQESDVISVVETESEITATTEQQIPAGSVDLVLLLTVLIVIAVVPFIYMKNRENIKGPEAATTANQVDRSPLSMTRGTTFQESSFSRHWQGEVETIGESCPSDEMSSFLDSSSCGKQERRATTSNNRRESMASSDCSTWSASYGSFTTYEKVPIKLGKSEEEFLTPVRRSNRIKKQVTSP